MTLNTTFKFRNFIKLAGIALLIWLVGLIFIPTTPKKDPEIRAALDEIQDPKQRKEIWKIVLRTAHNDQRIHNGCSCPNEHEETLEEFAQGRIRELAEIPSLRFESALSSARCIAKEEEYSYGYVDLILSIAALPSDRQDEILEKAAHLTKGEECRLVFYGELIRALGTIPVHRWRKITQVLERNAKAQNYRVYQCNECIHQLLKAPE